MGSQFNLAANSAYFSADDFLLVKIIEQTLGQDSQQQQNSAPISNPVMKHLTKACVDPNVGVREIALHTLGCVGMPEATSALDVITKCLADKES